MSIILTFHFDKKESVYAMDGGTQNQAWAGMTTLHEQAKENGITEWEMIQTQKFMIINKEGIVSAQVHNGHEKGGVIRLCIIAFTDEWIQQQLDRLLQ